MAFTISEFVQILGLFVAINSFIFTIFAFLKLKEKQTKLSLYYCLFCGSVLFLVLCQLVRLMIFEVFKTYNTLYRVVTLFLLLIEILQILSLFVMANSFFFKWSTRAEWLLLSYYGALLILVSIGIFNNFGWVILEHLNFLELDVLFIVLFRTLPAFLLLYMGIRFYLEAKKIQLSEKLEDKRALQLIGAGYLLYSGVATRVPQILGMSLGLTSDILVVLFSTVGLAACGTFLFLYVGFYKPQWFKKAYRETSWIVKQFNIDAK